MEAARLACDSKAPEYLAAAEAALAAARALRRREPSKSAWALEGAALVEVGDARRRSGQLRGALEVLERALGLAREAPEDSWGPAAWLGNAHHRIGIVHDSAGDPPGAIAAFGLALEEHRRSGDGTGMARVQNSLGIVYSRSGRYPEAIDHFEASLAHAVRNGHHVREAAVLTNLSIATRLLGRAEDSLNYAERSLVLRRETQPEAVNGELTNLALSLAAAGEHERAEAAFVEGERAHEEFGEPLDLAEHLRFYAEYLLDRGREAEVLAPLERALALAEAGGALGQQAAAQAVLARYWKRVGDHARALEHFESFHEREIAAERAAAARELEAQRWQAELALARAEAAAEKREREALVMLYDSLVHDHRDLEGRAAQLELDASLDALTSLANRRLFDLRLREAVDRSARTGHPCALVVIDLDRFKSVNDGFGHAAGDEVLRGVATVLSKRLRASDLAARLGGEEFAVLLPGADLARGVEVAHELRSLIASSSWPAMDPALRVTASLGVASSDEVGFVPGALMALADERLYLAKGLGRDRVEPARGA